MGGAVVIHFCLLAGKLPFSEVIAVDAKMKKGIIKVFIVDCLFGFEGLIVGTRNSRNKINKVLIVDKSSF